MNIILSKLITEIKEDPIFVLTSLLAIAGAELTSGPPEQVFERALGFGIWIISNGYFAYRFAIQPKYFPTLAFLIYEIFNIRGLINNIG